MKSLKSIMMMGFMLLIVILSKPVMAVELNRFTDVPSFSIVIGDNMYTLEYANDSKNLNQITSALAKNQGDIFIKTDDSGWIKNSTGKQVNKDSVNVLTIKYNNGKEIGRTVTAPVKDTSGISLTSKAHEIRFISAITKTGETTATFKYRVFDENGIDITKAVPVPDIKGFATSDSSVILDPLSNTGTIIFESSSHIDSEYSVLLIISENISIGLSSKAPAPFVDNDYAKTIAEFRLFNAQLPISKIEFEKKELTKTSNTTATFKYKVKNTNGIDITKAIKASQLVGNSIITSLDPSTGTGTITYAFSDTNEKITLTLRDSVTGITASSTFNAVNSKIDKITILSTKIGFNNEKTNKIGYVTYDMFDQYGKCVKYEPIANNVTFKSEIGTITRITPGTLEFKLNANVDASTLTKVIITATDSTSGISTSATLTVVKNSGLIISQ
ncbi:hypothetical protein [Clostridium sp. FP1]|uniref:hypothetical protein n=1 Tax=Clostridium sp. FP1 TaxID=2724076 RepID=UPI0013E959F3|nr:hypothetical protein [Clostridium sp. FP1]MBZ9637758.1 hypothetical protein [Clostridium sp. FP1]